MRRFYLSSSCLHGERIGDVVETLASSGVKDIELSGGTSYYDSIVDDLLRLKEEYGLSYLVHGYFPPPMDDFVIDLVRGSERALKYIEGAMETAGRLGCEMYSTHAGFTVDVLPLTRGESLAEQSPMNKREATEIFYNNVRSIMDRMAGPDARFAVENMYPLMGRAEYSIVSAPGEILEFLEFSRRWPNLGLLLDLGHLNLAAAVGGFDKVAFVKDVVREYGDRIFEVHISENDGTGDAHGIPGEGSWQLDVAAFEALGEVPVTFEWRGEDFATIIRRYGELLEALCSLNKAGRQR